MTPQEIMSRSRISDWDSSKVSSLRNGAGWNGADNRPVLRGNTWAQYTSIPGLQRQVFFMADCSSRGIALSRNRPAVEEIPLRFPTVHPLVGALPRQHETSRSAVKNGS